MQASSSPPRMHKIERESPPIHHPPTLLHPALLAAAQHGGSPDYGHIRAPSGSMNMDNGDRNSDCNSGDISYDGMQPTISFLCKDFGKNLSRYHVRIFNSTHTARCLKTVCRENELSKRHLLIRNAYSRYGIGVCYS